jgi:hypothetical protein
MHDGERHPHDHLHDHPHDHPSAHGGDERRRLARLREAVCLAHSVPGVSLRLVMASGARILVSHGCLGATLDPCRLRSVLLAQTADAATATRSVRQIEIVGGVVHLGGGLFQRSTADDERWFVTSLPHEAIVEIARRCPTDGTIGGPSIAVSVKPDAGLGLCAVRVRDERTDHETTLDATATWLLATCLVDELIADTAGQPQH